MEEVFYCGFNGFRQVPYQPDKQTITTLVSQCGKVQHSEKSNKVNYYLGFYRELFGLKSDVYRFIKKSDNRICFRRISRMLPYVGIT